MVWSRIAAISWDRHDTNSRSTNHAQHDTRAQIACPGPAPRRSAGFPRRVVGDGEVEDAQVASVVSARRTVSPVGSRIWVRPQSTVRRWLRGAVRDPRIDMQRHRQHFVDQSSRIWLQSLSAWTARGRVVIEDEELPRQPTGGPKRAANDPTVRHGTVAAAAGDADRRGHLRGAGLLPIGTGIVHPDVRPET
jgi:hypothetical protein